MASVKGCDARRSTERDQGQRITRLPQVPGPAAYAKAIAGPWAPDWRSALRPMVGLQGKRDAADGGRNDIAARARIKPSCQPNRRLILHGLRRTARVALDDLSRGRAERVGAVIRQVRSLDPILEASPRGGQRSRRRGPGARAARAIAAASALPAAPRPRTGALASFRLVRPGQESASAATPGPALSSSSARRRYPQTSRTRGRQSGAA